MCPSHHTQTHTDERVLLQAYKDLTEVMANQQDLVDIEHRLLPMLNVKVRPGLACTVADCHPPSQHDAFSLQGFERGDGKRKWKRKK